MSIHEIDWPAPLPRRGENGGIRVMDVLSNGGHDDANGVMGRLYISLPAGYRLQLSKSDVGSDEFGRPMHVVYVVGPKPRRKRKAA